MPKLRSLSFENCDFRSYDAGIHDVTLKFADPTLIHDVIDFRFENFTHPNAPLIVHLHGAI